MNVKFFSRLKNTNKYPNKLKKKHKKLVCKWFLWFDPIQLHGITEIRKENPENVSQIFLDGEVWNPNIGRNL